MRKYVGDLDIAPGLREFLKAVEVLQRDPSVSETVKVAFHHLAMMTNDPWPLETSDMVKDDG